MRVGRGPTIDRFRFVDGFPNTAQQSSSLSPDSRRSACGAGGGSKNAASATTTAEMEAAEKEVALKV